MAGMSARQFEDNIKGKLRKQFRGAMAGSANTHDYSRSVLWSGHTHSLDVADQGKRWTTFYAGQLPSTLWQCPYCGADHELTVKVCDGCGARRRQEYVH